MIMITCISRFEHWLLLRPLALLFQCCVASLSRLPFGYSCEPEVVLAIAICVPYSESSVSLSHLDNSQPLVVKSKVLMTLSERLCL